MANLDYRLDHDRLLAMGRLISKEFDDVDPRYMLRDSVSIESLGHDKARLKVELFKIIDWDKADAIINGREEEEDVD